MNVHASIDLTIQPTTIQGQWKILLLTCGFFKERCECYDCCFPFGTLPDCRAVLRHNIKRMGFHRQRMRSMNSNTSRCELHRCFSIQNGDRTINLRQVWRSKGPIFGSVIRRHYSLLDSSNRSGWSMQRAMSTLSIRPLNFKWSCRASASCGKTCILPFMWNIQAVNCSSKLVFDCICTILIHAYPSSIKFHTSLIKMLPEMESQWDT